MPRRLLGLEIKEKKLLRVSAIVAGASYAAAQSYDHIWAAWYNTWLLIRLTWLLIRLTPKGVVLSFLVFFSFL